MKTIYSKLLLFLFSWLASTVFAQSYEDIIKEQDAAINVPVFDAKPTVSVPRFQPLEYKKYSKAKLLLVDKIEVSNQFVVFEVGQVASLKKLNVTVDSCFNSPNHVQSDVALIQIKQGKQPVFHGWMFANSPSLNPMEHPFYDIILSECYE